MKNKSPYVVLGATGQTGSAVVDTLIAAGAPVRVVVRSPEKGLRFAQRGAEVAVADVKDAGALTAAFREVAGVYVMNPPNYAIADMFADAEAVIGAVTTALLAAEVPKVVALSSVGAHLENGTGNIFTTYMLERELGAAFPGATFVRCAWFMENWAPLAPLAAAQGIMPSFLAPLDTALPMVSVKDIGRQCAEELLRTGAEGRIVELSGPADYSPADVSRAYAKALGKAVVPMAVPEAGWSEAFSHMGVHPGSATPWAEMVRGFMTKHIVFEGGRAVPIRGTVSLDAAVAGFIGR